VTLTGGPDLIPELVRHGTSETEILMCKQAMRVFVRAYICLLMFSRCCFAGDEDASIWARPLLTDICLQYGFGAVPKTPVLEIRQRTFDPNAGVVKTDSTVKTYNLVNDLLSFEVFLENPGVANNEEGYVSSCRIFLERARSSKVMRDALFSEGVTRFLKRHGIVIAKNYGVETSWRKEMTETNAYEKSSLETYLIPGSGKILIAKGEGDHVESIQILGLGVNPSPK
jgi:hypothetical protein